MASDIFRVGQHILDGNDKLDKIEAAVSGIEEALQTTKADVESLRYALPEKLAGLRASTVVPLWLAVGLLTWIAFFK